MGANWGVRDPARELVLERLNLARDIPQADDLTSRLLSIVEASHNTRLELSRSKNRYAVQSKLKRVALLNPGNAVIAYDVSQESIGRPRSSGYYTFIYALAKRQGTWYIVTEYQVLNSQVVE